MAHIDPEYRGNGIAILFSVLTDPSVVTFERCRAGERVIQLDQDSGPAVISVLETMLTSPLTSPDDRLDIVYQLARLSALNVQDRHNPRPLGTPLAVLSRANTVTFSPDGATLAAAATTPRFASGP